MFFFFEKSLWMIIPPKKTPAIQQLAMGYITFHGKSSNPMGHDFHSELALKLPEGRAAHERQTSELGFLMLTWA